MNIKLFSDETFTKILGELIKTLRIKVGYTQEVLAYSICDRTTLNKLENGKPKSFDIGVAIKLADKLGVPFGELVAKIYLLLNADNTVLENLFRHLNDCDFDSASKYYSASSTQDTLKRNPKISKYYVCACLFRDEEYQKILALLKSEISHLPETLSAVDILLVNCYILAYLSVNYKDMDKIIMLENVVATQRRSLDFYVDYHQEMLIRMIVNLVDYYRLTNYIEEALSLLDIAEKRCKDLQFYDPLFDVYFNRLIIDIQYYHGKKALEYFNVINSYFNLLNKESKKVYIEKKYNYIKSLYADYYGEKSPLI